MIEKINYTTSKVDISTGCNDYEIPSSKNYLILLEAPPGAKVQIRLNSKDEDLLPLDQYFAIEAKNIEKIFVTCNAVPGEKLLFGSSKNAENFKIITAPVVKSIGSIGEVAKIGSFDDQLLSALDKISNPYEEPSTLQGYHNGSAQTTLLDTTLDCDKIEIHLAHMRPGYVGGFGSQFAISVEIDGIPFAICYNFYTHYYDENNIHKTLKNCRGKGIRIKAVCASNVDYVSYTLQKFNKKV